MTKKVNSYSENSEQSDIEELFVKEVKTFAKRMLKTSLFVGTFQEKRFVQPLGDYRDVIKINSNETDFIENLIAVKKKVESITPKRWIGITSPNMIGAPAGYSLWVDLQENILGDYWFKVKSVELLNKEFRLKLEIIRPFKVTSIQTGESSSSIEDFNVQEYFRSLWDSVKVHTKYFAYHTCTLSNIKDTVIFLCLLSAAIVTGTIHIVKYLMDYLLKLIKALSDLIKAVTPVLVATIKVAGNVTNTTVMSIANLVQGGAKNQPKQLYQPVYPRLHARNYRQRALPYKSSVVITEIVD
ncbi:uncharacterized protein LOC109598499 [Aethina tumida]|uniref:uncharacterized protein LOC109598499 n=1 Tax=Aethina tumida TaxID=116153 RepID=UPI002148272C|nr:uncharacterized protein LOC109598499 [Aethina tumida]